MVVSFKIKVGQGEEIGILEIFRFFNEDMCVLKKFNDFEIICYIVWGYWFQGDKMIKILGKNKGIFKNILKYVRKKCDVGFKK